MWVSHIQLVEGINRKRQTSPEEEIPLADGFWLEYQLLPGSITFSLPHRLLTWQSPHNCKNQFLKINLSIDTCCWLFLWRTPIRKLKSCLVSITQYSYTLRASLLKAFYGDGVNRIPIPGKGGFSLIPVHHSNTLTQFREKFNKWHFLPRPCCKILLLSTPDIF